MLKLKHPFTGLVVGSTGAGKTVWIFKLIDNADKIIDPPPQRIVYCYGEYQKKFAEYPQVEFHEGLPSEENADMFTSRTLIILDDLMNLVNDHVENLFTKMSHHRDMSVLLLSQNLFSKNKHTRTISLNTNYMVLFKNPRDASQFAILARQMFPNNSKFAIEAYRDATSAPYGYLFVDLKPDQDDQLRLRTNIFPGETQYVYVKR